MSFTQQGPVIKRPAGWGVRAPVNPPTPRVPNPVAQVQSFTSRGPVGQAIHQTRPDVGSAARQAVRPEASPFAARKTALQEQLRGHNEFSSKMTNYVVQAKRVREQQKQFQAARPQQIEQYRSTGAAAGGGGGTFQGVSKGGWGNYRNGQIPANALAQVSFARGHRLRADAAGGLEQLNQAFRAAFGRNIAITDSYRSLAGQQRLAGTKPGLAAKPGTSNHGWGLALDLGGGINRAGTREHNWMIQNAPRFGWHWPAWARGRKFEPWHWEYAG